MVWDMADASGLVDSRPATRAVVDYFEAATDDYAHWSPGMSMHFGLWRRGLSPFAREPMLDAMTDAVIRRLALPPDASGLALDLGCGVGSASRRLARARPRLTVLGVTLSPAQLHAGRQANDVAGVGDRVRLQRADYRSLPVADASCRAAFAIESACYDPSEGRAFAREAARVLRPGARLVVADGFRRRRDRLPPLAQRCHRNLARGWALSDAGLPALPTFCAALTDAGFAVDAVDDVSLRVAPTLLQVPLAVGSFRLRAGFDLDTHRRGNLRAPLWGLLGALLWPRRFGYYLVTARLP